MNKEPSFFHSMRGFLTLWAGQTVSQLGSSMTSFALLIWAYKQQGTVTSVALLAVCSYVPGFVFSLLAGPVVDRLPKKTVMLLSDAMAAAATVTVLVLYTSGRLQVGLLYAVNAWLGMTGAFQGPASNVAVSTLTPKEQYMRVSGLYSFSGSLKDLLSPVLATTALAFGGLQTVLLIDLGSFLFAFITLLLLKIPEPQREKRQAQEGYFASLREGTRALRQSPGVWDILLYIGILNLIAAMAYYSVLSPMILKRTGGNEMVLGWVTTCIGAGMLIGGLLVSAFPPKGRRVPLMCWCYTLSFVWEVMIGVGRAPWLWCVAAFLGNLTLPCGDGALSTLLRCNVAPSMQGRVFAVRGALMAAAQTVGYLLGAFVADSVAQPLCDMPNFVGATLRFLLGTGEGQAMGIVFLFSAIIGALSSQLLRKSRHVRALEAACEEEKQANGDQALPEI